MGIVLVPDMCLIRYGMEGSLFVFPFPDKSSLSLPDNGIRKYEVENLGIFFFQGDVLEC